MKHQTCIHFGGDTDLRDGYYLILCKRTNQYVFAQVCRYCTKYDLRV